MRQYIYFATGLLTVLFFGNAFPAYAQTDTARIFLDTNTIARGYQAQSGDKNITLTIRPNTLSRPTTITIDTFASRADAEQRFPMDSNHEFASDVYVYNASNVIPSDMRQGFLIDIKPAIITPWTTISFFDRQSQRWKALASRPVSSEVLRAVSPLPFAPVAVVQEKKYVGGISVSALMAQTHSLLVMDGRNIPLIAKNPRLQSPPASITKLMTALVFLDHNPGWKKKVTLQQSDDAEPARIPFSKNETVTTYDLFMGMLVGSNNNAAKALARSTGISKQAFVAAMNAKAARLKMYHTTFTDTSGLDPHNVSTVEDVVRLSGAAFKQKDIVAALSAKTYVIKGLSSERTYAVRATNALLASTTIRGKTGYIDESGYNFVGRAPTPHGIMSIAVFGAPTSVSRFDIVRQMLRLVQ